MHFAVAGIECGLVAQLGTRLLPAQATRRQGGVDGCRARRKGFDLLIADRGQLETVLGVAQLVAQLSEAHRQLRFVVHVELALHFEELTVFHGTPTAIRRLGGVDEHAMGMQIWVGSAAGVVQHRAGDQVAGVDRDGFTVRPHHAGLNPGFCGVQGSPDGRVMRFGDAGIAIDQGGNRDRFWRTDRQIGAGTAFPALPARYFLAVRQLAAQQIAKQAVGVVLGEAQRRRSFAVPGGWWVVLGVVVVQGVVGLRLSCGDIRATDHLQCSLFTLVTLLYAQSTNQLRRACS